MLWFCSMILMDEPSIINNERGFSPVFLSATVTPLSSHLKSEKKPVKMHNLSILLIQKLYEVNLIHCFKISGIFFLLYKKLGYNK